MRGLWGRQANVFVIAAALIGGEAAGQSFGSVQARLDVITRYDVPDSGFGEINSGQEAPSDVVPLNDGSGRLLVSNLGGNLNLLLPNGQGGFNLNLDPLLTTGGLFDQSGFTSVAVHPDFANQGTFGYGKVYTLSAERGPRIANNQFAEVGTPDFLGDPFHGIARIDADFTIPNTNGLQGESGRVFERTLGPGESQGSVQSNFSNAVDDRSRFRNPVVFHQDVIREWDLSELASNPNAVTVGNPTNRELYRANRPGFVHSTVDIDFGPDGLLYIASGDGAPLPTADISTTSQQANGNLGKLLRIDPNPNTPGNLQRISANTGLPSYSVPASNPLNGDDAVELVFDPNLNPNGTLAEVVALGLRSPYRLNVDDQTGDIYIGDVGQTTREEVSRVNIRDINAATDARSAPNFGWPFYEGNLSNTVVFGPSSRVDRVDIFDSNGVRIDQDYRLQLPGRPDQFFETEPRNLANLSGVTSVNTGNEGSEFTDELVDPVFSLRRSVTNTVVGGFVYRGSAIPELVGQYVFADFGFDGGGRAISDLFYGDPDTGVFFRFNLSQSLQDQFGGQVLPPQITSIGLDEDGEILLLSGFEDPRGRNPFASPALVIRLAAVDADAVVAGVGVIIPEPSSTALAAAAAALFIIRRRRA